MMPVVLRILLCATPVDMRRGFDGLAAMVIEKLDEDPTVENALFVFINARRNRAKILWRDAGGFCVLYKRLDSRVFALPEMAEGVSRMTLDAKALSTLLDGVISDAAPRSTNRDLARAARLLARERILAGRPQLPG